MVFYSALPVDLTQRSESKCHWVFLCSRLPNLPNQLANTLVTSSDALVTSIASGYW